MPRYYTRVCNFFYGNQSKYLVSKKKAIPLHQIKEISFDQIEIINRKSKKRISINEIKYLSKTLKTKINLDLKKIKSQKKNFSNLNFKKIPNILGVLNLTPDSFSDGGKYNLFKKAFLRIINMRKAGAEIIDIGGESTRPGSKIISQKNELKRVKKVIEQFKKKIPKKIMTKKNKKITRDGLGNKK